MQIFGNDSSFASICVENEESASEKHITDDKILANNKSTENKKNLVNNKGVVSDQSLLSDDNLVNLKEKTINYEKSLKNDENLVNFKEIMLNFDEGLTNDEGLAKDEGVVKDESSVNNECVASESSRDDENEDEMFAQRLLSLYKGVSELDTTAQLHDSATISDCELDNIIEEINNEFSRVQKLDCGKIKVGNDYGAYEINRKCGEPYARFCPCIPKKNESKCKNLNPLDKGCANVDLTFFSDLFSWFWIAKNKDDIKNPCNREHNNFREPHDFREHHNCRDYQSCREQGGCGEYKGCLYHDCGKYKCDNKWLGGCYKGFDECEKGFSVDKGEQSGCGCTHHECEEHSFWDENGFLRCDNAGKWSPANNCPAFEHNNKPCGKKLSRSIYFQMLQTSQNIENLMRITQDECVYQKLQCIKNNFNTLTLAMLAVSKRICSARPITMSVFEGGNCNFKNGVIRVVGAMEKIIDDIKLLQTLPVASDVCGVLVLISFGINKCQSQMYSLIRY